MLRYLLCGMFVCEVISSKNLNVQHYFKYPHLGNIIITYKFISLFSACSDIYHC